MGIFHFSLASLLLILRMLSVCDTSDLPAQALTWRECQPVPNPIGWAGMAAGVSQNVLIAGGGAHFPDSPPWAGGIKTWSAEIFALLSPAGTWHQVKTKFPQPLGYAVCVSDGRQIIVTGGESPLETGLGTRCRDEVLKLEWTGEDVRITPLPSLPVPLTQACGALLGTDLYIAGGISSPLATTAEKHCYRLNLASPHGQHWEELEPIPGPGRLLSVAAGLDNEFYLFGGAALSADAAGKPVRTPLVDCYRLSADHGWKRLADLPVPITAAPSPAPSLPGRIVLLGGDDGSQMKNPPERHRGFSSKLLMYAVSRDCFEDAGTFPAPHVTAPLVKWDQNWFLISGELRPGVRSPAVWQFSTGQAENKR